MIWKWNWNFLLCQWLLIQLILKIQILFLQSPLVCSGMRNHSVQGGWIWRPHPLKVTRTIGGVGVCCICRTMLIGIIPAEIGTGGGGAPVLGKLSTGFADMANLERLSKLKVRRKGILKNELNKWWFPTNIFIMENGVRKIVINWA